MTRCLAIVFFLVTSTLHAADPDNIVYDFSATWCGPCQQMAPLVARLEREGLPIRKVDYDQEKALAEKFGVSSLPTFVLVIDGKEVSRQSGAMTETDLRKMVAQIPSNPKPLIARNEGLPRVSLGESIPMPIDGGDLAASSPSDSNSSVFDRLDRLVPGRDRTAQANDLTVRGNDSELGELATNLETADPMRSSVRIRVTIDGKINLGSGTVIHSEQGQTRILTCAHIFRGFNEDSKIEVDFLNNQGEQPRLARLDSFNEDADLGVITVATPKPVPVAAIAMANEVPGIGDQVVGIGCSGGEPPSREQLRVTAIDKYVGPNNIECTGLPVRGRSGGGLFNAKGEVVGVCIAADKDENRGLYSGLLAVHNILEEQQLAFLFRENETNIVSTPETADPFPASPAVPPVSDELENSYAGSAGMGPISHEPNVTPRPMDVQAGRAEVVVIIRDPSQPYSQNRVVVIHDASEKFMSYLNGELETPKPQALSMAQPHIEAMPSLNRERRSNFGLETPVVNAGLPRSNSQLQQTSLSQPVVPQRYVRAAATSTAR